MIVLCFSTESLAGLKEIIATEFGIFSFYFYTRVIDIFEQTLGKMDELIERCEIEDVYNVIVYNMIDENRYYGEEGGFYYAIYVGGEMADRFKLVDWWRKFKDYGSDSFGSNFIWRLRLYLNYLLSFTFLSLGGIDRQGILYYAEGYESDLDLYNS